MPSERPERVLTLKDGTTVPAPPDDPRVAELRDAIRQTVQELDAKQEAIEAEKEAAFNTERDALRSALRAAEAERDLANIEGEAIAEAANIQRDELRARVATLTAERDALKGTGGVAAYEEMLRNVSRSPTPSDFDAALARYNNAIRAACASGDDWDVARVEPARQRVRELHEAVVREREALVLVLERLLAYPALRGYVGSLLFDAARALLSQEAP